MTSTVSHHSRLVDIFPPGFDSKSSSSRGHYNFVPEQFYRILTEQYDSEHHVEFTHVKSVWYGKQKKGPQHEFILIEIENTKLGLINFIVLDRNTSKTPIHKGYNEGTIFSCGISRTAALDAFRVSYNGNEEQLVRECELFPRRYLEKLEFSPQEPLFLYQLATLVHIVSDISPNYILAAENCYWFAGLVWECIRCLRQNVTYDNRLAKQRGRFAILRYTPEAEEINGICEAYKHEIQSVESSLEISRRKYMRNTHPVVPHVIGLSDMDLERSSGESPGSLRTKPF